MDNSDRPKASRLLLNLALAVAKSEYPVPKKRRPLPEGEDLSVAGGDEALSKEAWERLEDINAHFESELRYAASFLEENPPRPRVKVVLDNSSVLRKVAILQQAVDRAYSFRLDQPAEGLQVSNDLITLTTGDPSPLVAVIRGRAWMERGNFLRILGDSAGAYQALAEASSEIEANGIGDPLELARYQELLGILERDCGNFATAADLLRKALTKFRRWGDNHSLQRVLIASSLCELYNGNNEQAAKMSDESMTAAEPSDLFLRFAAVNRLLIHLWDGDPPGAYRALLKVRHLGMDPSSWYRDFPDGNRAVAMWTEGQVLSTVRINDEAVPIMKKAREFFIRSARGCEVCHISIDLAANYAAQQRFDDVRHELAFGLPFCSSSRPLDNHAREAVGILQGALEHQGRLEPDQVRVVAHRLDRISRAPLQAPRRAPFADLQL